MTNFNPSINVNSFVRFSIPGRFRTVRSSTETTDRASDLGKPGGGFILDATATVTTLAAQSTSQADFLQRMAADLMDRFPVEVVAITHSAWDTPMMLVSHSEPRSRLDGRFISALLQSSTTAASACDVPLKSESDPGNHRTRGLHVSLLDHDGQRNDNQVNDCAVLLVYGSVDLPDAMRQIRDLQRLAEYVKHCRIALRNLAVDPSKASVSCSSPTSASGRALRHFHNDLDPIKTAYRIANETRRVLEIDRVTVLIAARGRLRVEAVSGVAVVDRRANAVTAAEEFARRVTVLGRPIVLPSQDPLPPQIADPLDQYLDDTDVAAVAVMPLYATAGCQNADGKSSAVDINRLDAAMYTQDPTNQAEPIAVILLESFSDDQSVLITPPMREVGAEAAVALSNSLEHRRIFGLRFLKTMGDWFGGRNLPYTTIALISAAALLAASLVIQVDHQVIATGYAEPSVQQNVFARTDGIVKQVLVHDGQQVTAGDVLMRLENAELETNAESLSGEIQTTARRLVSIGSMLLDPATDAKQASRMSIEQQQMKSELASFQQQLLLVREQLSDLDIQAPIDGIVAGWQLKRRLVDRPVTRGNLLLTVARQEGPWQLRLEIHDTDAAEIVHAFQIQDTLTVEFAAASHPSSTFAASLDSIATSARRNENGVNVFDATAAIQSGSQPILLDDARSGVEATAKITCGRRSVLRSWFGDVADFVNRNILFYIR